LRLTGPNHFTHPASTVALAFVIFTGPTIQNSTGSSHKIRAASSNLATPLRRLIKPRKRTRIGRSNVKRSGYSRGRGLGVSWSGGPVISYASGITDNFSTGTPPRITPSRDHSELTTIRSARLHSSCQEAQYSAGAGCQSPAS